MLLTVAGNNGKMSMLFQQKIYDFRTDAASNALAGVVSWLLHTAG